MFDSGVCFQRLVRCWCVFVPIAVVIQVAYAGDRTRLPERLTAYDIDARKHVLGDTPQSRGVVLVFLATECPISNGYAPRLNTLSELAARQGLEFYGVVSDRSVTRLAAKQHATEYHVKFPVLFDSAGDLHRITAATHTPQAFVFDSALHEIYRGQIDDSYARLGKKTTPHKMYLTNAIHAASVGSSLPVALTEPVGCLLEDLDVAESKGTLTFARDIAPIVFSNCVVCHREGEVAPFPLMTFEHVSKRARQIADVVTQRIMPPWKPAPNYAHFADERRLDDSQIALFRAWAEDGAPEGNNDDLPPLPQFPSGWRLGKPNLVLRMPRPFIVPADGPDIYQHFVIPLGLPQDRLISAIEVHPGNPKVVHHAHMFLDTTGEARLLDAADPGMGYTRFGGTGLSSASYLGGWNPGANPHFFPQGTCRLMSRNGDVIFQIHYHPSGKPEPDQTEIGIYFAPAGARQVVTDMTVGNVDLLIPSGQANVRFTAEYTLPVALTLLEIRPHMHLLGKSYEVRGVQPNGQVTPLIKIDAWDFNWQDSYAFEPPVRLPAGTRIQVAICYDNSAGNPANPSSPPKTVYFGEESTDEMSNCAIRVTAETVDELKQLIGDNGRYWSGQMQRYLARGMTPDKKRRDP